MDNHVIGDLAILLGVEAERLTDAPHSVFHATPSVDQRFGAGAPFALTIFVRCVDLSAFCKCVCVCLRVNASVYVCRCVEDAENRFHVNVYPREATFVCGNRMKNTTRIRSIFFDSLILRGIGVTSRQTDCVFMEHRDARKRLDLIALRDAKILGCSKTFIL